MCGTRRTAAARFLNGQRVEPAAFSNLPLPPPAPAAAARSAEPDCGAAEPAGPLRRQGRERRPAQVDLPPRAHNARRPPFAHNFGRTFPGKSFVLPGRQVFVDGGATVCCGGEGSGRLSLYPATGVRTRRRLPLPLSLSPSFSRTNTHTRASWLAMRVHFPTCCSFALFPLLAQQGMSTR